MRIPAPSFSVSVLQMYLGRTFFMRFLMLLIGLSVVLESLDVLSQSGDILAAEGATSASLWRFAALRFPQMIANVVAFSALLATIITCSSFSQHSEVIVMKSAGLSSFRIVLPMMAVCAGIAAMHFVFNETIVINANDEYERWHHSGFRVDEVQLPPASSGAWATDDNTVVRVQAVTRDGTILDRITLYRRDDAGRLISLIAANFAAYVDGSWTLFDVRSFSVGKNVFVTEPKLAWETDISPDRFAALSIDPQTIPFGELSETVARLSDEGTSTYRLRTWLHHKITGPLGTVLMPLLGCLAAFGVFRSGALFFRVLAATGFGFSYFIVDNFMLAVGQFGTVPAVLAAWAPMFLFLSLGYLMLFYTEE